jgi:hypothetical protein
VKRPNAPKDPRARELLVDRALHGLNEAEAAELRTLAGEEDESFEQAAAAVHLAAQRNEEMMPSALADKILASALTHSQAGSARVAPVQSLPKRTAMERRPRETLPWALAAACLLLAVGGWLWGRSQKGETRVVVVPSPSASSTASVALVTPAPSASASSQRAREALLAEAKDVVRSEWHPTKDAAARGASGDVVWSPSAQRGYMRFAGLEANDPATSQYQLWIFDSERDAKYPVDGGVFDVPAGGEVIVPISAKLHVGAVTLFAVTVEKPGGVVVSKRGRIVVTAAASSG